MPTTRTFAQTPVPVGTPFTPPTPVVGRPIDVVNPLAGADSAYLDVLHEYDLTEPPEPQIRYVKVYGNGPIPDGATYIGVVPGPANYRWLVYDVTGTQIDPRTSTTAAEPVQH